MTQIDAPEMQQLQSDVPKVKDALGYLERVKNKFSDSSFVYTQFLDIMKDFKAQTIDTEGVIMRVKNLFRGNSELILGFNQFLPAGYKIEITDDNQIVTVTTPPQSPSLPQILPPSIVGPSTNDSNTTVEFSHAVKYVAKIKSRLANKPQVYEEFLDILHAYQQKRTINEVREVYERVQKLFGDQQDLLREFTYFLPENAALQAESVSRKEPREKRASKLSQVGSRQRKRDRRYSPDISPPHYSTSVSRRRERSEISTIPPTKQLKQPSSDRTTFPVPSNCEKELPFLDNVKQSLPRFIYIQFLKVLNLYTCEVITRCELVVMIEDLFRDYQSQLTEQFKQIISFNEWDENQLMTKYKTNYYAFVSSVDFSTCKQVTPSYRQLPANLPPLSASGRTALCDEVLNDFYLSLPNGNEDTSFRSTKKNQHEEILFNLESERHEIDLLISANENARVFLDRVYYQLQTLNDEDIAHYKIDTSNILHIRAISRLYGEQGYSIIEYFKKNPLTTIPVILKRIQQKDLEWKALRDSLRPKWRKIMKDHYTKSLDHRSFYFQLDDKKRLSSRVLLSELSESYNKYFPNSGKLDPFNKNINKNSNCHILMKEYDQKKGNDDHDLPIYNYCMRFRYDNKDILNTIYELLRHVTYTQLNEKDAEAVEKFLTGFLNHFFMEQPIESLGPPASALPRMATTQNEQKAKFAKAKQHLGDSSHDPFISDNEDSFDKIDFDDEDKYSDEESKKEKEELTELPLPKRRRRRSKSKMKNDTKNFPIVSYPKNKPDVTGNNVSTQVKPISLLIDCWKQEEETRPVRRHIRNSCLFLGTTQFYTLLRFHRFFYERLLYAQELINNNNNNQNQKKNQLSSLSDFTSFVRDLLDGEIDSTQFEEKSRELLGSNAYVLFTIDKLILQLIKNIQNILSNDLCVRLLILYKEEYNRYLSFTSPQLETSAVFVRFYLSRYLPLVQDEENQIQFEFFEDTKELFIGVVEEKNFSTNVLTCINQTSASFLKFVCRPLVSTHNNRGVYLKRNLLINKNNNHKVLVNNGLKSQFTQKDFKVVYVENTEDYSIRLYARKDETHIHEKRVERFEKWLKNEILHNEKPTKHETRHSSRNT